MGFVGLLQMKLVQDVIKYHTVAKTTKPCIGNFIKSRVAKNVMMRKQATQSRLSQIAFSQVVDPGLFTILHMPTPLAINFD